MRREETFEVGDRPRIQVRMPMGFLSLINGPKGTVTVQVEGHDPSSIHIESTGQVVSIGSDPERGRIRGSYTVTVHAPLSAELDASVASADIDVETVGALRAAVASGDINVGRVAGDLSVKSASGDVTATEVGGRCRVMSASGDVEVQKLSDEAMVTTASGDIEIGLAEGDIVVKTASGDTRVRHFRGGEISGKSMSGDLKVGIPGGTQVELDVHTLSGKCRLPESRSQEQAPQNRHASVSFKSISGDLEIEVTKK